MEKEFTYQMAFEELQSIVHGIEQGETSIDQLAEKVARAMDLIEVCRSKITDTEQNVNMILAQLAKDDESSNS